MQKRANGERISVASYIPNEQLVELQKAAEKLGCTVSTIARMAINEWAKKDSPMQCANCESSIEKQPRRMRIALFVTKEQHKAIQLAANQGNCTVSTVIMRATNGWIQNHPND